MNVTWECNKSTLQDQQFCKNTSDIVIIFILTTFAAPFLVEGEEIVFLKCDIPTDLHQHCSDNAVYFISSLLFAFKHIFYGRKMVDIEL